MTKNKLTTLIQFDETNFFILYPNPIVYWKVVEEMASYYL